jgi:hypothetical protein
MQKMKRFVMMLVAALLLIGAGYSQAKAVTIDPSKLGGDEYDFSTLKGVGPQTISFTLHTAADTLTVDLLGLGIGQVSAYLCSSVSKCNPLLLVNNVKTPDSHSFWQGTGLLSLASTAEFNYSGLLAGTYYLKLVGAPVFAGLVFGAITAELAATPIPASLLMFLTALGGLGFMAKRRKSLSAAIA